MERIPFISPYPNQGEVIRFIANAFDTKSTNRKLSKELDDYCQDGDSKYWRGGKLVDDIILTHLESSLSKDTLSYLKTCINHYLEQHIELVKTISLEGLSREVALPALIEHPVSFRVSGYVVGLYNGLGGPHPYDLLLSDSALDIVFLSLERNIPWWSSFIDKLPKEEKDKIRCWRKTEKLASRQSLLKLQTFDDQVTFERLDDWKFINDILIISRAIDYTKKTVLGALFCKSVFHHLKTNYQDGNYDIGTPLTKLVVEKNSKYQGFSKIGLSIQNDLCHTKEINSQSDIYNRIGHFEEQLIRLDPKGLSQYFIHWQRAKFLVLSNELEQANSEYEKAFSTALYNAGKNQERIISEALCIAAINGDRSFMLNLVNQAIVFGYLERPTENVDIKRINKKSRSKSIEIEDWQVEKWKSNFSNLFPSEIFFYGVSPPQVAHNHGVVLDSVTHELKATKNTVIGNKTAKTKKMPTLALAALDKDYDQFDELLRQGIDYDFVNEDGESALLIAIENMNIVDHFDGADDRFFNKLTGIQYRHSESVINAKTTKKKLTPLTSAIKTGRYGVVQQLLDWGAEIDQVATTDEISPLYVALSVISKAKQPEQVFNNHVLPMMLSPRDQELLAASRHNPLITGNTAQELQESWSRVLSEPLSQMIMKDNGSHSVEQWKLLQVEELRRIARLLIERGADPNKPRTSILEGYTPLMFAVELNEVDLVEFMVLHGGNICQTYLHPDSHEEIDLMIIAKASQAEGVVDLINRLKVS